MAVDGHNAQIERLAERFAANPERHAGVDWKDVLGRLGQNEAALRVLEAMEKTGGEPDVTGREGDTFIFTDCAAESPLGRRSLCFDRPALDARKANKPEGAAMDMAARIGCTLLDEDQYRALQALGTFDLKTSSWIATPGPVRALGGALFCDRRFGRIFTYHNGAESYYSGRGFRGRIVV